MCGASDGGSFRGRGAKVNGAVHLQENQTDCVGGPARCWTSYAICTEKVVVVGGGGSSAVFPSESTLPTHLTIAGGGGG